MQTAVTVHKKATLCRVTVIKHHNLVSLRENLRPTQIQKLPDGLAFIFEKLKVGAYLLEQMSKQMEVYLHLTYESSSSKLYLLLCLCG